MQPGDDSRAPVFDMTNQTFNLYDLTFDADPSGLTARRQPIGPLVRAGWYAESHPVRLNHFQV